MTTSLNFPFFSVYTESPQVEAVRKATAEHSGYAATSVVPTIADGHATAEVTLNKGQEWKTVTEKLG